MLSPLAPPVKVKNTFIEFDTLSEDEACLSRNRASSCPPRMSFNGHGDDSYDVNKNQHCKMSGQHDSDSDNGCCSSTCTGVTLLPSSASSSHESSNITNDTSLPMRTLKSSQLSAAAKPWSSEERHKHESDFPSFFLKQVKVVVRVAKFCFKFVTGESHITESKAGIGNWWTLVAHVPSGVALDTKMALATVMEELQHTAAVTKGVSVLSIGSLQLDMPTEHGFRVVLCGCGETPQHPPETAVVDVKVAMLSNCVYQ